ncbi:MAG: glycosyltransferase family 2 protein, partial [Candidatus Aenigmarchaeota archaeon]|nr:glycosyltransferase family 2 protein [Candidatus Aenigmarchaeota archaeon]
RVFRRDMAMRYFNLYPSGFSLTSTITMAALSHDYAVKYVPINYFKRVGKSSINPVHFVNFLILVMRLSTLFNPLKVFIPFSIVLFVAGIAYGIYQFMLISNIGDLPVMLVLAAVQVGIFGFIADAIAKQRK